MSDDEVPRSCAANRMICIRISKGVHAARTRGPNVTNRNTETQAARNPESQRPNDGVRTIERRRHGSDPGPGMGWLTRFSLCFSRGKKKSNK